MNREEIVIKPIGIIHTPFTEQKGTPIQPATVVGMGKDEHNAHVHIPMSEVSEAAGRVEVFPEYVPGLKDLDGFERIILIFRFHKISREELVVHPYLDTKNSHGIFATRAPCRPNRIGLSCVRLKGIEKNILHIEEVDILDGSPLLDIKPYVPQFDSFAGVRAGWTGDSKVAGKTADSRFEDLK